MIDEKAIEEHIRGILAALGDDPEREGLIDTPKRVAKMYAEIFAGNDSAWQPRGFCRIRRTLQQSVCQPVHDLCGI